MEDLNFYRSPGNCIGSKIRPNPGRSYKYIYILVPRSADTLYAYILGISPAPPVHFEIGSESQS